MNGVTWEPHALQEFNDALAASRDAARFRAAVDAALALIQANPQIGAAVGRRRGRQHALTGRLPYSIVYTDDATGIRVVAFPHSSRKPGYWLNRLPRN